MKKRKEWKQVGIILLGIGLVSSGMILFPIQVVKADTYTGEDLALAILENASNFISSTYYDTDQYGNRQSAVLSSLGTMQPMDGSTFALFSTGIAGANPVTESSNNPGSERGSWFAGGQYGYPRDKVVLTMTLQVPAYMHYLYYDVQFFSSEYPEYIGSQYNDKLTITVDSPNMGSSQYMFDVNSGYFVLDADDIPGTGYDIYAMSGYAGGVDWVTTSPQSYGADGGASDIIPIGGITHPVAPYEEIIVTIKIVDTGDNQFDSTAFIDNLMFIGYARTNIVARKTSNDLNDGDLERGDTLRYSVTISNTGSANQYDNTGNEFEDIIPSNATYVPSSASATSGSISYVESQRKIIWNGQIPSESSVSIHFDVQINDSLPNNAMISNQGTVYWDSNEDRSNDAIEYTDDPYIDDGLDLDGDSETNDDDPTIDYVIAFEAPQKVYENFTDDVVGSSASQSYMGRTWFTTSEEQGESNFEVASSIYLSHPNAFKIKLREVGSPQYWYYNLSNLESIFKSWNMSFYCGNASEQSILYMNFTNSNEVPFARLKIEYENAGSHSLLNWIATISYWSPSINNWQQLSTDTLGYLYKAWYTLHIEQVDSDHIRYTLEKQGSGVMDSKDDAPLVNFILNRSPDSFDTNLKYIEWRSTLDPVVCPMFFWDCTEISLIPQ